MTAVVAGIATLLLVLLAGLLGIGIRRVARHYRKLRHAAQMEGAHTRKRLADAVDVMQHLRFPLCAMPLRVFKAQGELIPHEQARNRALLEILDTWDEAAEFAGAKVLLFVSHQWLGTSEPDPDRLHFAAVVQAADAVCREKGLSEDDVHLWVDYHSIPQKCVESKRAGIASIAVYACCAKLFVVVAPDAVHTEKQVPCNAASYARRGWCRLEQWAFMGVCGVRNMYLGRGAELHRLSSMEGWLESSAFVFEGDFSVEADKHSLVDVILGLYGFMLICYHNDHSFTHASTSTSSDGPQLPTASATRLDELAALERLVREHRERLFPFEYFQGLDRLLVEQLDRARSGASGSECAFSQADFDKFLSAGQRFAQIQGRDLSKRRLRERVMNSVVLADVSCKSSCSLAESSSVTVRSSRRENSEQYSQGVCSPTLSVTTPGGSRW